MDCSPNSCKIDDDGNVGCTVPGSSGIFCKKVLYTYGKGSTIYDSCVDQAGAGYSGECVYLPSSCARISGDTYSLTCFGSCAFNPVGSVPSGNLLLESSSNFSPYVGLALLSLLVVAGYSVSKSKKLKRAGK